MSTTVSNFVKKNEIFICTINTHNNDNIKCPRDKFRKTGYL
jgi:hypothetical protein